MLSVLSVRVLTSGERNEQSPLWHTQSGNRDLDPDTFLSKQQEPCSHWNI